MRKVYNQYISQLCAKTINIYMEIIKTCHMMVQQSNFLSPFISLPEIRQIFDFVAFAFFQSIFQFNSYICEATFCLILLI